KIISYPWYIQPPLETNKQYKDLVSPSTEWSLSLGYGSWLLLRILGLFITGIAVSQGSSFWYDIIRQIKGEQKKTGATSKESTGTIVDERNELFQSQRFLKVNQRPGVKRSSKPPAKPPK